MEINKQLFEDVLSGKLKGTFVLRNGKKIPSDALRYHRLHYELYINGCLYFYYDNGRYLSYSETQVDIIDFIPDTDMKENELTIEIPNDKVVDWDESKKQNKIVLKDKQLTYEDVCEKLFSKLSAYYFVNNHGSIYSASSICNPYISNPNSASTAHQLECILAKNKLANVAKCLNDGWKPSGYIFGWFICTCGEELEIRDRNHYKFNNNIIFKSKEAAKQAIEILGEETIKLALKPLGI